MLSMGLVSKAFQITLLLRSTALFLDYELDILRAIEDFYAPRGRM